MLQFIGIVAQGRRAVAGDGERSHSVIGMYREMSGLGPGIRGMV